MRRIPAPGGAAESSSGRQPGAGVRMVPSPGGAADRPIRRGFPGSAAPPGLLLPTDANPQLALWAAFCRRSAAGESEQASRRHPIERASIGAEEPLHSLSTDPDSPTIGTRPDGSHGAFDQLVAIQPRRIVWRTDETEMFLHKTSPPSSQGSAVKRAGRRSWLISGICPWRACLKTLPIRGPGLQGRWQTFGLLWAACPHAARM